MFRLLHLFIMLSIKLLIYFVFFVFMRKIIFLLITLITLTNVSYASFPVIMGSEMSIDTIRTDTTKMIETNEETTAEFHSRIQKQGFDIDNCMCEDCRRFKGSDIKEREDRHANSRKYFRSLGASLTITLAILVVGLVIGIIRGVGNWWNNSGYSSV